MENSVDEGNDACSSLVFLFFFSLHFIYVASFHVETKCSSHRRAVMLISFPLVFRVYIHPLCLYVCECVYVVLSLLSRVFLILSPHLKIYLYTYTCLCSHDFCSPFTSIGVVKCGLMYAFKLFKGRNKITQRI